MIHITDGITDKIVAVITNEDILDNVHRQSLEDNLETFEFITYGDRPYSQYLSQRNRIIIPAEDSGYIEFIIEEVVKIRDYEGVKMEVYAVASYLDLIKAKVIEPTTLEKYTPSTAVSWTLGGTEWRTGVIEGEGYRTFHIENHRDPFSFLKTIANEFELELRFRVETNGHKVTERYVEMVEQVGEWQGREIELGRDLMGVKRTENTENVYTALLGLGPEREDGTRLEVLVEDEDALQRWGRINPQTGELMHLIGVYEPESDRQEMTLDELRQYTRTELDKRINEAVTYIIDISDLEHVPGLANKRIRFGDTIKIKDTKFNPPLYVEARVYEQERNITDKSQKRVKLGDYTEYTEEEVQAIWKTLQEQIRRKISLSEALEVVYTKEEVDERDIPGNEAKEKLDRDVGDAIIESVDGAQQKAEQAEQNAKDHADSIKQQLDAELAKKASQQAVEAVQQTVGNLQDTANSLQQAVSDHADELAAQDGRITTVETDLDTEKGRISAVISDLSTVEDTISQQQTQISANTNAIALKASQDELDTVKGDVSSLSGELNVLAGKVELKAERSEVEALEGDVSRVSNDLAQLTVDVGGISSEVSSVRADLDGLEIGGRNLLVDSTFNKGNWTSNIYTTILPPEPDKPNSSIMRLYHVNDTGNTNVNNPVWNNNRIYLEPKAGDKITVSFDFYCENESLIPSGTIMTFRRFDNPTGGSYVDSIIQLRYEDSNANGVFGKWVRVKYTYTFTSSKAVSGWYAFGVYMSNSVSSGSSETRVADYKYREIKIEHGDKATDWTPAPEDVQAEISAVEQYASSIDQKADSISATVSSLQTTVGEHGTQISQAQTDIQAIAGQVSTKAEASEVTELGTKVTTVEQNLSALEGVVETKVDDGEARSIFLQEASSFTFSAEQINFDGAVFGKNATFNGTIKGAEIEGAKIFGGYMEIEGSNGFTKISDSIFNRYDLSGGRTRTALLQGGIVRVSENTQSVTYESYGLAFYNGNTARGAVRFDYSSEDLSIWANGDVFIKSYNNSIIADGNLLVGGASKIDKEGRFISTSGFVTLRSESSFAYVQSPNRLRVTKPGTTTNYVPVTASSFDTGSLESTKRDIHLMPENALDIINKAELYKYKLINEGPDADWRYGLVIGEGYKTPKEVMGGEDSISQYDMNTFSWKAIQELTDLLKELRHDLDSLEYRTSLIEKQIQ